MKLTYIKQSITWFVRLVLALAIFVMHVGIASAQSSVNTIVTGSVTVAGGTTNTFYIDDQSGNAGFTQNKYQYVIEAAANGAANSQYFTITLTDATARIGNISVDNSGIASATNTSGATWKLYYTATTYGVTNITFNVIAQDGTPSTQYKFRVVVNPVFTSVSPNNGPTTGGTTVTLTGAGFKAGYMYNINGRTLTSVVVAPDGLSVTGVTATSMTTTNSKIYPLGYTVPSIGTTCSNCFTTTAPSGLSISPTSGSAAGGTTVTITGLAFWGTTGVTIGGRPVTSFTVNSGSSITAVTPSGTVGTASVVVTNGSGSNAANSIYTYTTPPAPTITSVSPASGPAAGGNSVTITGTNLTSATSVTIDGATAVVTANTATSITATAPSGSAGVAKNVAVTTAGGTVTSTGVYTYIDAPTIASVSPSSGPIAGGTSVTITGTNLTGATAVSFGGTTATTFTVNSATSITATAPAHAAGASAVAVTTVGGTATSAGAFSYLASTATLQTLSLSSGTLSPTFASGTTSYTASVSNATSTITVTPTVTDSNATVKVNTVTVASGVASGAIALNVGANTITTVVTAQDGTTTQTYTTTVTRAGANNAALSNLVLSSGTLSPTFAGGTTSYTSTVTNAISTITVTPTVSDSNATVKVNGITVVSGSASGSISLNVGSNTITTVVTAQDGTTTQTYTTTVTRSTPASNVATLSAMTISSGTLSPVFASGTASYTASVTNATTSITVTPTVTQANATITVNGTAVTSGNASGAISLSVGSNTITTVVTAQDGTTTQTYTTAVTRAALLAQAAFTVSASPTTLNATTTSSTLSSSGGSGAGAVSYAVTTGSCTVSGSTISAGTTSSETCTVTATKASDGTYAAATATVNITVARRANIAAAATDASVLAIHGAQIMQSQKFVTTQIENVANHLNGYRNNFNLRPSTFGFGVNLPSLGPASQALYKIKDELTPRPEMQAQNKAQSKDTKLGMKKVGYVEEQDLTPYNDYMREEELAAEKIKQEQAELEKVQQYASNSQYERENLTYSVWTAGTIDYATYKTGDNKETQNKLTANGLTMGIDYKLHDTAIVGAAVGVGTAWQSAVAINTNLKAKQTAVTGYGMFGFADHWVVEGLMGYGVVDFSGNRTTSDGAAQLGVNRKGETLFSSGTISKMYWVGGYKVTPFARQDVMHINLHSYAETGAADYALGFDGTNFVHTTTSGGLQVSRDIFLEGAKLTPTAKIALNRIRTGGLAQNIYYADTGAAGGVYTLNQTGSYMTTQSLGLGLVYTTRAGDGFDLGWQGAIGANQYKLNGLRFAVRFAM